MMKKKKRILVGGTFDIIHVGHIKFLRFAKQQAKPSELIVVIARDPTVKRKSGHYPIFGEKERKIIIESLEMVDKAVLGNPPDKYDFLDILSSVQPDMVVLGHDQFLEIEKIKEWAKKHDQKLKVKRAKKFDINGISSSSQVRNKARRMNDE